MAQPRLRELLDEFDPTPEKLSNPTWFWTAVSVLHLQKKLDLELLEFVTSEVRKHFSLERPQIKIHTHVESIAQPGFAMASASATGRRRSMEDVSIMRLEGLQGCMFVMDGHGGNEMAVHLGERLSECFGDLHTCENPTKFFTSKLDCEMRSGSCLTGCTFSGDEVKIYNVGDSTTYVLDSDNNTLFETKCHKPLTDYAHVEEHGGNVFFGRVNGVLAVSRAFGNAMLPCVVPKPDVTYFPKFGTLISVCDGITDVLTKEQICQIVTENDPTNAAIVLVNTAFAKCSQDNLTAVVAKRVKPGFSYLANLFQSTDLC